ncbi:MAG: hypothetical protein AVDCRST_MAG70-1251, partial [uncultured Thermomicrobiales bacterium]
GARPDPLRAPSARHGFSREPSPAGARVERPSCDTSPSEPHL